jgi:CDP-L-myo-inositol myo-inositolphosphotransferase
VVAGLPLALRALLELERAGMSEIALAVADPAVGEAIAGDARVKTKPTVVVVASADEATADVRAPILVVSHHVVAARAVYAALAEEAQSARVELVDAAPHPAGWVRSAQDPSGRRAIVRDLFEACRKPVDGIVSRHLNRHVSIFVSKLVVDWPISPNAITLCTVPLAIGAALATVRGTYAAMLAGAALLQLNSILDGVDGELARVRFQHSRLGQWLDTVCDDVSNVLFFAAITYVALALPPPWRWLGWCGVAAVGGSLATMTMYYVELARLGSGDFYALDVGQHEERAGLWGALQRGARYVTKRDFFVASFVVAAALDVLVWVLPIVAAGTFATTVTGLRITLRRLRATARPRTVTRRG